MPLNPYGNNNPPYSLYQTPDGKWGLMDKDCLKLPAIFDRYDDRFSAKPWEVVRFNEQEGWDSLAWYDPCEVWFNFTFDDPAYPPCWAKLLWQTTGDFSDYHKLYNDLLPPGSRWVLDAIEEQQTREREIDDYNDWDREIRESRLLADELTGHYPGLTDIADSNALLAPVLDNDAVESKAKSTLWVAKVALDNFLDEYKS